MNTIVVMAAIIGAFILATRGLWLVLTGKHAEAAFSMAFATFLLVAVQGPGN